MSETLTISSDRGVFELYNLKTKVYPSGLKKLKKYSFDTILGLSSNNLHNGKSTEEQLEKYLKKRVKERKEKIIDIAFANDWKYFLTLTFDGNNKDLFPDGYSHEMAIELLTKWIDNQKHKNRNMKYIIVSEFHKESKHLHFHGLFNNVNWSLNPATYPDGNLIFKNDCQIFNLDDYKLGFSTISEIKDSSKVSVYLSKYITKELISLKNKKVFWYSRNLYRPFESFSYCEDDLNVYIKDKKSLFYKKIDKKNCKIEVANIMEV